MNKMKRYSIILVLAVAALSTAGCKKFLAVDPAYTQDAENYFQTPEDYENALTKAFLKLDSDVEKQDYAQDTGTTACVVLITPTEIYCANAGDSRGVLCRDGKAVALSEDHKPDNEDEIKRIQKAEHFVEDSRVDGNLALSRAFGDF